MKLEEATGFCGARQHRWLRQGYEGINGTTEKMSKACPAKKKGKWHKRKGTWANWNFWLWLWLKNKSPLIDPRIFMNLPQFFIGPSKFNDPISFERQPSCFLQLHRFWNRVILANGTLFTHVCIYIYIYTYIYTHKDGSHAPPSNWWLSHRFQASSIMVCLTRRTGKKHEMQSDETSSMPHVWWWNHVNQPFLSFFHRGNHPFLSNFYRIWFTVRGASLGWP